MGYIGVFCAKMPAKKVVKKVVKKKKEEEPAPEPAPEPEPAPAPEPEPEPVKEPEPEPEPAAPEPVPVPEDEKDRENTGKWNALTKGDRFEMTSDDRHTWHKITFKKVKMNEAGLYSVKVVSKGKEETAQFSLKVSPAKKAAGPKVGKGSGRVSDQADNQADVDFRAKLRKSKKKKEIVEDENVWVKLRDANTRDYENIAFEHSISDVRGMLRRLSGIKKREGKKIPTFAVALPPHKHYQIGEKMVIVCETK